MSREAASAREYYEQARQALRADMKGAAIMYFAKAVLGDPGNADHIRAFADSIKGVSLQVIDPDLKQAVVLALDSPYADPQEFAGLWYNLLSLDPAFAPVLALTSCENYQTFRENFDKLPCEANIEDDLFLKGLRRLTLPSIVLEKFLTNMRHALVEILTTPPPNPPPAGGREESKNKQSSQIFNKPSPQRGEGWVGGQIYQHATVLAAALGHYCFYTGYIFDCGDDEKSRIKIIKEKIAQAEDIVSRANEIALLSCYEPLHDHPLALKIAAAFAGDPALDSLVQELIEEPLAERAIAKTIPRLTSVDDDTSRAVQLQYTEFPYPRWRFTGRDKKLSSLFEPLKDKPLDILIAGCGTGQEAMYYSAAFPQARILAADLSLASLSYAVRKARERGADNIGFLQADILALPGTLDRDFDIIISSGVLHHMREPEKGFAVLHGLLKQGGLMRISLYSELARRHIAAARNAIAAHDYKGTAGDMRRFRRDAPRLLAPEELNGIMRARDYFIMPQCRDLLFHVMEHRFDIPGIDALLEKYGCEFLEFVLGEDMLARYRERFPDDQQARSLENWAAFEAENPDMFAAMYRFVCRKK